MKYSEMTDEARRVAAKKQVDLEADMQTAQKVHSPNLDTQYVHYCDKCGKICEVDDIYNDNQVYLSKCCKWGYSSEVSVNMTQTIQPDMVNHPPHYGGEDNPYETIKVLSHWLTDEQLVGFCLGNAIKYLSRMDKKGDKGSGVQDAKKAQWYLNYLVTLLEPDNDKAKEQATNGGTKV